MKLYTYFRSSASYRVRIALHLKGITFEAIPVDLRKGEQAGSYKHENPQGLVPYIVQNVGIPTSPLPASSLSSSGLTRGSSSDQDPRIKSEGDSLVNLGQSLVILDYLEQVYPTPALLPMDPALYWKAKELAQFIACEMHPLNNLRVLKYLQGTLQVSEAQKNAWYFHWLKDGFDVLEKELSTFDSPFALTDHPTWADLCLIPQMYNAHRFGFDLTPYPRLLHIEDHCLQQDAFQKAAPEAQSDCDV